ncbi:oocyte zinc finger protein XlCOF6-like [Venturia nashicola]|uniref:Oocyte zinc finger protein XlCOF6-like n=1 Tax=Venturia nashicola TaxID=86259 RepID=A0A4Z1P9F9_9PEZI|nr:oocyte zinc finger protein XlCOF6-like [Venturia nashicola]
MSSSGPASFANNNKDVDLNNVGSRFHDQGLENGADRYPAAIVEDCYDYGSLAASARLADEVDDITQQTTRALLEDSAYTVAVGPAHDASTHNKYSAQQGPVYTSWQPRCSKTENTVTPSLDDLPVQRRAVSSSLAPQSSSEGSVNEAQRPAQAHQKRPSYDNRPILPANPAQYQHPPGSREEPPIAAQPPRITHAAQPQPQIAPRPLLFAPQTTEDYGCSECGKVFNRKSDLVHHKRYHTRNFDRPYKCDECGQGFIHYKDLARHMPRHTGQRSFQCPFSDCDKTYTRKDNLNRHVRHDHAADPNAPMTEDTAPQPPAPPAAEQRKDMELNPPPEAGSRRPSVGNSRHDTLAVQAREPTPSNGKRPIDEVDSERPNNAMKARRQPKERWAHRLGCPFRKCRPEMFTTPLGYRVCHTTPHEFTIRLLEHLKRNHDIFVCGDCFLAFTSLEFLTQHKNAFVHCAECYLSFPNKNALAAHSQSCVPVDSSTQEDVWQIMYETICSDGVRHNPVFEEDDPVPQSIDRSNLERMERLRAQSAQPGQVASFNDRLRSSVSSASSANDNAPSTSTADQRDRQQMAPAGSSSYQSGYRAYGSSQTQEYRPQELSHLQAHVSSSHPVISHEAIVSAVIDLASPRTEVEESSPISIWHPDRLDLASYVAVQSVSHVRFLPTSVMKPLPVRAVDAEIAISALPMAVQAYHCPSLTSESTTESQEQRFDIPHDIPHYSTMGLPQDPNLPIKQRTETFQYSWFANMPNNCGVCGANIDSDLRYCEDCSSTSDSF